MPDDDGLGVEDPRHGRDVADHPPDERVHDLERRDVDQHAVRAVLDDALGEVVLQRRAPAGRACRPGCHQEELAHLEDRDAFHRVAASAFGPARATTVEPDARAARPRSASASVALVITSPSSTPRWTIVWAICGPDAADDAVRAHQPRRGDRLQQVLGDERVHGRHAGDVDDRDARARSRRSCWSRLSITTCVRALSSVPISGRARTPVPQLDDRRRQLEQLLLLAGDHLLAALLVDLGRVEAELVEQQRGRPDLVGQRLGVLAELAGAAGRTAAA